MAAEKTNYTPAEPELPGVEDKVQLTLGYLSQRGMNVATSVHKNLENAIRMGSIPLSFLDQLVKAADAFGELKDVPKSVEAHWLKNLNYLSRKENPKDPNEKDKDLENIKKAEDITSLEELELHVELLPLYLEKVQLIKYNLPGSPATILPDVMNEKLGNLKNFSLTFDELKKVHEMKIRDAVRWLKQHNERVEKLSTAARKDIIPDRQTFDELRSNPNPSQALKKIDKLTNEHNAKKRAEKLKAIEGEINSLKAT